MVNKISINIWDDYTDDGEIQETYAYVESDLNDENCKHVLEAFKNTIEMLARPNWSFELSLQYYDSAKDYPNLVGTVHESCLYKRWQLQMKNLSHQTREYLIEILSEQNLEYLGTPIDVYSES